MEPPKKKLSPMMAQWYYCKKQAKEALLLFRLGDFYEAFYDDASILAHQLNLTLTQRQGIPMSGVPFHAVEGYIEKLVAKGFLIAIAEQIEDPKTTKGLVKREVVRTISPGTLTSESFLEEKSNNFFACLTCNNATFALSLLDLSTGELIVLETQGKKQLQDELFCHKPSEILTSKKTATALDGVLKEVRRQFPIRLNLQDEPFFDSKRCYQFLISHFRQDKLDTFGLSEKKAAISAAGALLNHVSLNMSLSIEEITDLKFDLLSKYMTIDQTTQRNLELIDPLHLDTKGYTLLKLLDRTKTPMGGRLFRTWVVRPLLSTERIWQRQAAVRELIDHGESADLLVDKIKLICDLERLIMRVTGHYGSPRDLCRLKLSFEQIPAIKSLLASFQSTLLTLTVENLPDLSPLIKIIEQTLVDNPPIKMGDGPIIRQGFNASLDQLRELKSKGQSWIARYQKELKEVSGIKTLKIIYSKAFGYCIEVSRGQASRVPSSFERRQTLVNAERFISPELKSYEEKILTAEEKIIELEGQLYQTLRSQVASKIKAIKQAAHAIAILDSLLSLREVAKHRSYICPQVDDSSVIAIQEGRHPVIESALPDHTFIPNDIKLDDDQKLILLTGPNMGGKSTYIRQVALMTIMAQMGSFIPARSARIGIVDKVFSRIGASDDLSRGQSTFMVEMTETAHILRSATPHSLIILDEVGRGTSTSDGIALASAVVEYLLKLNDVGVKTLFATHYLELTELEKRFSKIKNFNLAIRESSDTIAFLHKIIPGSADKSYGIHVAKLANFPESALARAEQILKTLKSSPLSQKKHPKPKSAGQPTFFDTPLSKEAISKLAIAKEVGMLDLNNTTPSEALQQLFRWQQLLQEGKNSLN